MTLWDLFDNAWRLRVCDCAFWRSDAGSVDVRSDSERLLSRFKYVVAWALLVRGSIRCPEAALDALSLM